MLKKIYQKIVSMAMVWKCTKCGATTTTNPMDASKKCPKGGNHNWKAWK